MRVFDSCFSIWCDILKGRLAFRNLQETGRGFCFSKPMLLLLSPCWIHGLCALMAKTLDRKTF